jgi:hypothetical protein
MTLFLADETNVSADDVAQVVREQLAVGEFNQTDSLRTAVMYLPVTLPVSVWVEGCRRNGINEGTARNRWCEVKKFQREMGELK